MKIWSPWSPELLTLCCHNGLSQAANTPCVETLGTQSYSCTEQRHTVHVLEETCDSTPEWDFSLSTPFQVNFLDSLRTSSVEGHVQERNCFCSVFTCHTPTSFHTTIPLASFNDRGRGLFSSQFRIRPCSSHFLGHTFYNLSCHNSTKHWAVTSYKSQGESPGSA